MTSTTLNVLSAAQAKAMGATFTGLLKAEGSAVAARRAMVVMAFATCRDDYDLDPDGDDFALTVDSVILAMLADIQTANDLPIGWNYSKERQNCENGTIGFYIGKAGPVIAGALRLDLNAAKAKIKNLKGKTIGDKITHATQMGDKLYTRSSAKAPARVTDSTHDLVAPLVQFIKENGLSASQTKKVVAAAIAYGQKLVA